MIANRIPPLIQLQRGLLFQYGWLRSWWQKRPLDAKGLPLPWITYPAIDFLSQFDFSNAFIFEWGSGFSTLWWNSRCRRITTIESNPDWISYIKPLLPQAVEFVATAFDATEEVAALERHPHPAFDILIIDNHGPFRWRCAEAAVNRLADGGFIILDNSEQCLKACAVLRDRRMTQIDFTGFAPGNGYAQTTSIFFRDGFKFKSLADRPFRSPAQPNLPWPNC